MVNAIEELISGRDTNKCINLYEVSTIEYYIYKIVDNGPGINESDIKEIFNAGFSTKFHNESGDSNRGLGLFIVKELIETMYNGEISIESEGNIKTEFIIKIPKKQLEVNE